MSQLQPYGSTGSALSSPGSGSVQMPSRYSSVGREVARSHGAGMVRAVNVDVESRLNDLKLSAAASLGGSAQQQVATMTAMEAELTRAVPLAGNRLEMIGNLTTIGMTEIVTDAISKLRRL